MTVSYSPPNPKVGFGGFTYLPWLSATMPGAGASVQLQVTNKGVVTIRMAGPRGKFLIAPRGQSTAFNSTDARGLGAALAAFVAGRPVQGRSPASVGGRGLTAKASAGQRPAAPQPGGTFPVGGPELGTLRVEPDPASGLFSVSIDPQDVALLPPAMRRRLAVIDLPSGDITKLAQALTYAADVLDGKRPDTQPLR